MEEKKNVARHEESWCPVFCPMDELDGEISKLQRLGDSYFSRRKFLEGVKHTRIFFRGVGVTK